MELDNKPALWDWENCLNFAMQPVRVRSEPVRKRYRILPFLFVKMCRKPINTGRGSETLCIEL